MIRPSRWMSKVCAAACAAVVLSGCSFQGLNSLSLPGTVGHGPGSQHYLVEIANVGTLEPNSPVLIDDVVVGSVGAITVEAWHANVEVFVRPGVVVPANAAATVGQTSLLGSMHLALDPPPAVPPSGRLVPGATIPLSATSSYPSTERTLSALSAVVNAGGLGQLGDVVHNFSLALTGREADVRGLIEKLDRFVGTLDAQRDDVVATITALNRFAGTLAARRDVLDRALHDIPPALDVLVSERPNITTAMSKLGHFARVAGDVVSEGRADLVSNLANLRPAFCALADVGPDIDTALAYAPVFPLGQNLIDRGVRGDYVNLFATFDLTTGRLRRGLAQGTPFFRGNAALVPAPGDPGYDDFYAKFPDGKGTWPVPPWLQSLPPDAPPLHDAGVAPLGVPAPILTLPPATTPSGCS